MGQTWEQRGRESLAGRWNALTSDGRRLDDESFEHRDLVGTRHSTLVCARARAHAHSMLPPPPLANHDMALGQGRGGVLPSKPQTAESPSGETSLLSLLSLLPPPLILLCRTSLAPCLGRDHVRVWESPQSSLFRGSSFGFPTPPQSHTPIPMFPRPAGARDPRHKPGIPTARADPDPD